MVVSPLSSARFPVPLDWGAPPAPEAVPAARWLVEALAVAWGWYPEGPGKVVWFEFPEQHEAPCPTHGWGTALGLVLSSPVAC